MPKEVFRFKQFECSHCESSMKIGVDAVLIGAWTNVDGVHNILDVGCGCGVISLICAQRAPKANITAIDIDVPSVRESAYNFEHSPWSERLDAECADFNEIELKNFDLIISNPPYFDSGVTRPSSARLTARHQDALSPARILRRTPELLSDNGSVAMIVPADQLAGVVEYAETSNLVLMRSCMVRGHDKAPVKRALIQFAKKGCFARLSENSTLTLEITPGVPTGQYRSLCKELYLKF